MLIDKAVERRKYAFRVYAEHLSSPIVMSHSDSPAKPAKDKFVRLLSDINHNALQGTAEQTAWLQAALVANKNVWFWSDLHLNHQNIIKYCSRPFNSSSEMNAALIAAAQNIPREDLAIIVGDFAMGKKDFVESQWAKFQPCRLIAGNHDQDVWGSNLKFPWADAIQVFFHGGKEYWVTHYPIRTEMLPENVINIHGHIHHRSVPDSNKHINVSAEITGYKPKLLNEVIDA
jgi:calcineurin-like phosphoesterase family protein